MENVMKRMEELKELGGLYSKNRYYKVGDVLRWTPGYASIEQMEGKGLAVVIESQGPKFTAYFLGDGSITKHDARPMGGNFILQDLAPLPQVAEWLKSIQREFV